VLGWVGRPHARKGLPLVLAGWRLSTCGARGGVLMIAGCTEEECRALFGTLPSGVRALGYCADMPGFYRCCDAVILVSAHEGMSYALLEGGASGCALIGSDIPGTRDLVIDGETGLLVAQQAQAVAAAIGRLDQDPGLSRALGQRARQRSIALFDREEVIAALYRFYLQELGDVRER